ncbi:hypothetical protein CRD60_02110 [Bifidobacterium aemilianum]|uniref:ABC transporter ATP-binding protein n=1 Tax=Bifidobacterium aemilianum TaxID=2493120 RepID=A0A366K9J5_9BIFI|nr:hypothetical protein [Bifidobacterium aemilianum]RBP97997.1 hypothetical protein CRD60_02110 [Bifidobacterium aemilianum]
MQTADVLTHIKWVRSEGRSVLVICHDLPNVFALCDRIVVLRQGPVTGIHRSDQTSYEQIIAEIAGVLNGQEDARSTIDPQQYGNLTKQRRLIDRTMYMQQTQGVQG